jgi:hypothetical protein
MFRLPLALGVLAGACTGTLPAPPGRVIEVVARDYAFEVPDTVAPGRVRLTLRNAGKVPHEMIVMKLRRNVSLAQLMAAYDGDLGFRLFLDGGNAVLFAPEGGLGDGALAVDLEPGRDYVLWCNFTDGEGHPEHARLGMFKRIHVREGAPAPAPVAVPQLVVETGDYAFRLPDTVAAGPTELRIRNTGAQRHEAALSRLKAGASAAFFFAEYLKGHDVDSLYDDDGVILTAYPGDDNRTAILVDFQAGRTYVLLCEFQDAPDAPRHAALGMVKALAVRRE